MRQLKRVSGLLALLGALVLLAAACSSYSTATTTTTAGGSTTPTAAGGSTTTAGASAVSIANFAFSPATLNVSVGTTVTWTNRDNVDHTVTSDTGAFSSGQVAPGSSFSFTFNQAGTFAYHCSDHATMKAEVIVSG